MSNQLLPMPRFGINLKRRQVAGKPCMVSESALCNVAELKHLNRGQKWIDWCHVVRVEQAKSNRLSWVLAFNMLGFSSNSVGSNLSSNFCKVGRTAGMPVKIVKPPGKQFVMQSVFQTVLVHGGGSRPEVLPVSCPALSVVGPMYDSFHAFVVDYDGQLAQMRYRSAKHRRSQNLHYVFKDCKAEPLPQADTLLDTLEVGVEEVREEDTSLVLVEPAQLWPDIPVVAGGKVLEVLHASTC